MSAPMSAPMMSAPNPPLPMMMRAAPTQSLRTRPAKGSDEAKALMARVRAAQVSKRRLDAH